MGILDELGKSLGGQPGGAGGQPAGGQGALMQAIMGLITSGGLQQLIASFQQKGLGDVVGSWVSTGPNKPISPAQVQEALGQDRLGDLSARTGLEPGALAGQLSGLLPGLIDKLTPDGNVPEQGALQDRLGGLLKGLF
jgi:uncharacterized protein YidB (DUF937 family)